MDVKTSKITYPKSVLALYLKLFCKRRNSDKNKMLEGIQSWLTLSKSEKQQFFNKYKECRLNHKVKLANYLMKVQPYLKKIINKRTPIIKQIKRNDTKLEIVKETVSDSEEHNCDLDTNYLEINSNNDELSNYNDHPAWNSTQQSQNISIEQTRPVLAEPAPPSIRSGKELFEMLKATSEDNNNDCWATLSNLQKNRYQRTIQLLKNDYIRKYKAYLESLPPKELFNCYNNNVLD